MRMFIALCANEGYICIKVDATNAYANSPPPDQPTFVYIDQPYADWFLLRNGFNVPRDHVLPVQHALQGHPESGALWEFHKQGPASAWLQIDHARTQLVPRNVRWMEDAYLSTSG
ncbi:hypothetical protein MHU86_25535 [Fragilaria crotonensis]|nr:hypothetical protein MHU86_25535 [Fragilaria crotonensis]